MSGQATALAPARLLASVSRSHPGLRRNVNEDRVLDRADLGVWAVADGMGGHRHGDLAAARLIDALDALGSAPSGYARLTELARRVEGVNAELFDRRGAEGPSGSTLVALLVHEGHYACVWAGDSRAYLWRDGVLAPISRDHSRVQDLVDAGALSEGERGGHPQAHVITRAVGAHATLQLEPRFAAIRPGDVFLLCSDGLPTCVPDVAIATHLAADDLPGSADRLLATALDAGAPDNVSLLLVAA